MPEQTQSGDHNLALDPARSNEHDRPPAEVAIERRRVEDLAAAARRQAALLERVIASVAEPLLVYDASGVVIQTNPAAVSICGFDPVGMGRGAVACALSVRDREGIPIDPERLLASRAAAGEPVADQLLRLTDGEGRERIIGASASPIPLGDGTAGAVAVWHDVTDRERLLEKLERTAAELRRANEEKDVFVALLSHELRAPLAAIYGSADVLRKRGGRLDPETRAAVIEDLHDETERLARLVENMLAFVREGKDAPVEVEPVIVRHLLNATIGKHREDYPHRRLRLRAQREHLVVAAEPSYLEQVLGNLLVNAEKYSPPDRPIEVRLVAADGEAQVSVLDRGPGIESGETEALFQPFYRSGRTAHAAPGAGIGLAVCRLLVRAQGGRIWARPRPGGGSEFCFTLPLYRESAAA